MLLSGTVEIDEAYVGGKESNKHESKKLHEGRGAVGKTAVIGIKQRDGKTVAKVVESADKAASDGLIESHVSEDAVVNTDDSAIYKDVFKKRKHSNVNHSAKVFVDRIASNQRHRERLVYSQEDVLRDLPPVFEEASPEVCRRMHLQIE